MLVRGYRGDADRDNQYLEFHGLRMCRFRNPYGYRRRGVWGGIDHRPSRGRHRATRATRTPRRRGYSPLRQPRDGWTAADYRARRLFQLGMLSLIAASIGDAHGRCPTTSLGNIDCGNKMYPDLNKPAIVCSALPTPGLPFSGSWFVMETVGNGGQLRKTEIAVFDSTNFILKTPGFLGLADAGAFVTELWPPTGYVGIVYCAIGNLVQNLCIIPVPKLHWSLSSDGIITVERLPGSAVDAFGHTHCRSLGPDSGPPRYSRTFWGVNKRGVVAVSEETPGDIVLHWSSDRSSTYNVNSSNMALSFAARSDVPTCVTCIAGSGGNILSLSTTECRTVRVQESVRETYVSCDCHAQRFAAAVCSMLFITVVSTILYAYLVAGTRPRHRWSFYVQYVRTPSAPDIVQDARAAICHRTQTVHPSEE
nr:protein m164 [Mastomys natalensis cytomegalovirus 3]WEG70126.1 protein m164 [Mastomys natalensis cytomegalovirus 3]WEG70266.1 protein m164 [Mastomys natalensis cytomegalovirus 3]WEG70826.1 protein m164 [Mastomys natalensis cytomegalovirus 3]